MTIVKLSEIPMRWRYKPACCPDLLSWCPAGSSGLLTGSLTACPGVLLSGTGLCPGVRDLMSGCPVLWGMMYGCPGPYVRVSGSVKKFARCPVVMSGCPVLMSGCPAGCPEFNFRKF